jgi:hypothetical protein
VSSIAHRGFVHLPMDVSKNSIAVAVLPPDRDVAEFDKIFHETDSVRRLVKRIGRPKGIWACYEAGPTGYDLQRHLDGGALRRGGTLPHPEGPGRPCEDRPEGCQAVGRAPQGRRATSPWGVE